MDFFSHLFSGRGFMPRVECGNWTDGLIWATVVSEQGIWFVYMVISGALCYLAYKMKPPRELRVLLWFYAAFVNCCGWTHIVDSLMFWHPLYRLVVLVNLVTGIVSFAALIDTMYVITQLRGILSHLGSGGGQTAITS